jgi:hypothetical protein
LSASLCSAGYVPPYWPPAFACALTALAGLRLARHLPPAINTIAAP